MPNLLRRFLEMYLGFNYPSEKNFRKNLKRLIADENKMRFVYKIINELSHSQNFERAFKMYETDEIKQAVQIIFESFEESEITKRHLDELVKSTGIIDTCVIEENTVEVS